MEKAVKPTSGVMSGRLRIYLTALKELLEEGGAETRVSRIG